MLLREEGKEACLVRKRPIALPGVKVRVADT
jgi:hypothetical protein